MKRLLLAAIAITLAGVIAVRGYARCYPPAPSLAGPISDTRQAYIDKLDRTCAETYNENLRAWEATDEIADPLKRKVAAARESLSGNRAQYRAFVALGEPPDGKSLHARWLGNKRERVTLELRKVRAIEADDDEKAAELNARILDLKVEANGIGQRFGLQICTSNGPGRNAEWRFSLRRVFDW